MTTLEQDFSTIYDEKRWGEGSGAGSDPDAVPGYLDVLRELVRRDDVNSVVDIGCGDWRLGEKIDWPEDYVGIDVVRSVVEQNRILHPSWRFVHGDATKMTLPSADLLVCKDVLQHLSDEDAASILRQLGRYRYALLTQDVGENAGRSVENFHRYAPMDLQSRPFSLRARVVWESGKKRAVLWSWDEQSHLHEIVTHGYENGASEPEKYPSVCVAILAKQAESFLPFYLACIRALDYPKKRIHLYVRTNNNTDDTAKVLRLWLEWHGDEYASVSFDDTNVDAPVEAYARHEWNADRFRVLADIRQKSVRYADKIGADFYFCADADNFVRPRTLRDLVALNLPVVAPFLRHETPSVMYSNFHSSVDDRGYFAKDDAYDLIWSRKTLGLIDVPVVHCTYLVRRDIFGALQYDDGTDRHEYVVMSHGLRICGIPQYLDNRRVYGYLHLDDVWCGEAMRHLAGEVG